MRTLLIVLALSLPSLAYAGDPCAKGWNGPINANTNSNTQPQNATTPVNPPGAGSLTAQKTAYPH